MEILRPSSSDAQNLNSDIDANALSAHSSVEKPKMDFEDFICVLQMEPNDSFMARELAQRLLASGRKEEALRVLRAVIRMDNCFETLFALGSLEYQMDLEAECFQHLQQALLVAPEGAPQLFELLKILGNIFVRHGDLDSAEDAYFKAHRLNPNSDILHVNLGTLSIQRQAWDEAADKFRTALALNSINDKAWVGLAICHRMKGDWELAWGNVQMALQCNPLNEVALQLILDWSAQEGREGAALEPLRNFLIEGGWNEKMSLAFAYLSFKRGDLALAKLELERLLAVNPGNHEALALVQELRGLA